MSRTILRCLCALGWTVLCFGAGTVLREGLDWGPDYSRPWSLLYLVVLGSSVFGWIWCFRKSLNLDARTLAVMGAALVICVVLATRVGGVLRRPPAWIGSPQFREVPWWVVPSAASWLMLGVWVMAVATSILRRLERMPPPGRTVRCPRCGYDLRGQKHARCPECGTEYTIDQLLDT